MEHLVIKARKSHLKKLVPKAKKVLKLSRNIRYKKLAKNVYEFVFEFRYTDKKIEVFIDLNNFVFTCNCDYFIFTAAPTLMINNKKIVLCKHMLAALFHIYLYDSENIICKELLKIIENALEK